MKGNNIDTVSGISESEAMSSMPQGTHFCLFFETDQDLHEMLSGYFKAGLEKNEFCLWITSGSTCEAAGNVLKQVIPDAEKHLETGDLEILQAKRWYINNGDFNAERVINSWDEKLSLALSRGYKGMRVVADLTWLEQDYWKVFCDYEKEIDKTFSSKPIIIVCAYPAAKLSAAEILDVARTHHFVAAKRNGSWEILESPELKQDKADFKKQNKERTTKQKEEPETTQARRSGLKQVFNYTLAVLSVIAAVLIQFWMRSELQTIAPESLLICAVIFSAWYGGLKPGLLATALSCLAYLYFFLPPHNSFAVEDSQMMRFAAFFLSAHFVALLSLSQKKAVESLRKMRDSLKKNNQILRSEIVGHMQSADALRQSETKFRELAESIRDIFYAMDSDLRYTYWNKASEQLSGIPAREAIGKSIYDIFPDTRGSHIVDFYLNVINTQQPDNIVVEYPLNGKNYVFEINAYPVSNGISIITKDISERKKNEEQLLKYKRIVSTTPEGVALLDKNYRYEIINDTYEKYSGLKREQIIGHTVEEYLGPEVFRNVAKERFDRCLKGETIQFEDWFEYANLGKRFIRVTYFPYRNISNEITGVVAISQDITELKNSELKMQKYAEELKRYGEKLEELVKERTKQLKAEKEKAESADRMKSAFLAAMSHELRTPLNSIIGFTGILLQKRPGPLNDEQKKQLEMVRNSAHHLLSLISDILDLSKIEAGQLTLNFERFNLAEAIYKVAQISEPMAVKKNLKLNVSIAPEINGILSDKLRVRQILLNLVNNAVKFTEKGSVKIECTKKGDAALIEIIDTGIGIERDRLKDIFHPFVQIDSGIARKHEGTGLGLSISKSLISLLNGTIQVKSEYGKGSIFSVLIPLEGGTVNE